MRAAPRDLCRALSQHALLLGRFQLRCVLRQPLTVYPGADVHGELRLIAHKRQSYDIHLRLSVPSLAAGVPDHVVNHLHLL